MKRGMSGLKPSGCADWARRERIARLRAMTARERVILALSLKERSRLIQRGVAASRAPQEKT